MHDPSINRSMIGTSPASRTCLGCSQTPRRSTDRWTPGNPASVTAMDGMFKNATSFNQPLSEWSFPASRGCTRCSATPSSTRTSAGAWTPTWSWRSNDQAGRREQPVLRDAVRRDVVRRRAGGRERDRPAPTALPTSVPSSMPTKTPTAPSPRPSSHPSVSPSLRPTPAPSVRPTPAPSVTPTPAPTTPQPSSTPTTSAPSNGCVMALHQFLQPMSCEGCARWIGEPADDNCIREFDGVATCQSKAATIAPSPAGAPTPARRAGRAAVPMLLTSRKRRARARRTRTSSFCRVMSGRRTATWSCGRPSTASGP